MHAKQHGAILRRRRGDIERTLQQFTVFTISHPLSGDFPYAAVVVVAVPMVVREAPLPIRKAVGDLSAAQRALFGLPI